MTKVVYNECYGGFSLSDEAIELYLNLKGLKYKKIKHQFGPNYDVEGIKHFYATRDIERDDPVLVQVVEKLGDKANGECAKLCIEDLPKGTLYRIKEYDGYESIETKYNDDWSIA